MAGLTNPMKADLDMGGHNILDVRDLTVDGNVTATKGVIYLDGNHNRPSVRWGTEDPNTDPRAADAQPGSLFLLYGFQTESAWIKTAAGWRQLAFVA